MKISSSKVSLAFIYLYLSRSITGLHFTALCFIFLPFFIYCLPVYSVFPDLLILSVFVLLTFLMFFSYCFPCISWSYHSQANTVFGTSTQDVVEDLVTTKSCRVRIRVGSSLECRPVLSFCWFPVVTRKIITFLNI